jgi:type IV pilus assembly protein PilQ
MNRIFSALGVSLWMALLSPMVQAANLKALDVAALPGDRVELKLVFDDCPGSARCRQSAGEQDS